MVIWGGLRPIASRVFYDFVAIAGLVYATSLTCVQNETNNNNKNNNDGKSTTTARRRNDWNGFLLLASFLLTVITAGNFTNRWTLTFPMIPLLILQGLRRIHSVRRIQWLLFLIQTLSVLCILVAIKLCILFPAVELPPILGAPYHVGTTDVHIPLIDTHHGWPRQQSDEQQQQQKQPSWLPVRVLYPTLQYPKGGHLYLQPETASEYCRETMRFGSPPPLQTFDWMLHTWRLTHTPATPQAPLVPGTKRYPIVVYSHGLGGNADIYTYQTLSLAARGNIVVVLNHLDGSAPIVRTKCGKEIIFDYATPQLPYAQAELVRRNQTDRRVLEVVAATEAVLRWNHHAEEEDKEKDTQRQQQHDDDDDRRRMDEFVGRLETGHVTIMGHSFGGVTALTAAKRRPDLYHAVVAHEPAMGWMPDDARRSFFSKSRLHGLEYSKLDRLWGKDLVVDVEEDLTAHDKDTLILSSHEWREKDWGDCRLVEEMHVKGRLGPKDGVSHFAYIEQAHHNEFSDTCMLTPLWLARTVGVTGTRNPLDTAQEIHERTVAFLNETRRRHGVTLDP